jgi:hypothetical protein
MKLASVVALSFALLLPACATTTGVAPGAPEPGPQATRVIIENHQWDQATVTVYCQSATVRDIRNRTAFRVPAVSSVTHYLLLDACYGGLWAHVKFLGHTRTRQSAPEIASLQRAYVHIKIPNNLDYVFLAIFPLR